MKIKKASKKKLATIQVRHYDKGFSVWITSKNNNGIKCKHWLIDASCLLEDGTIRLGTPDLYSIEAVYDKDNNEVIICKK